MDRGTVGAHGNNGGTIAAHRNGRDRVDPLDLVAHRLESRNPPLRFPERQSIPVTEQRLTVSPGWLLFANAEERGLDRGCTDIEGQYRLVHYSAWR